MDSEANILNFIKEAGKPVTAGEIEKISGIKRREVDKVFKKLKSEGKIVSPVHCRWVSAEK